MKKNTTSLFVGAFALAICLIQCKGDGAATRPEAASLDVSPTRASEVAFSYSDLTEQTSAARHNLRGNATFEALPKRVSRIRTLKDDEHVDLMHVIDYIGERNENRGFIIVAATGMGIATFAEAHPLYCTACGSSAHFLSAFRSEQFKLRDCQPTGHDDRKPGSSGRNVRRIRLQFS